VTKPQQPQVGSGGQNVANSREAEEKRVSAALNGKKTEQQKATKVQQKTKAVKVSGPCPCGCGETPRKGVFVPGHDGRVSGWFRQVEAKKKQVGDLPKSAQAVFASWVRLGRPGGNHPHVREAATKVAKVPQPTRTKKVTAPVAQAS
jgi:hypothetical protein